MPGFIDENMEDRNIGGTRFTFKATRLDELGATEYTLVTIVIDMSGSVFDFTEELRQVLVTVNKSCQKSPRSENLMVRAVTFESGRGVQELHGFKLLSEIDPAEYPELVAGGMTPLYDATFSAIGAMVDYGADLMANDFLANGIAVVVTDGEDNNSTTTPRMIHDKIVECRQQEKLESITSILVGINAGGCRRSLKNFQREAGLDQYIDAGEATPSTLARLAAFVSQSVSSTSVALGTGGPSQNISATI